MQQWTKDPDEQVRRLASEGCRPRLPWVIALPALKQDPTPIFSILKAQKDDPSELARRSVANNMNDISKDNPLLAMQLARAWYGRSEACDRLVRHGLKTLLKQGHPDALTLLGCYHEGATVKRLHLHETEIPLGKDLVFSFELHVPQDMQIRRDYALYFLRKNRAHSRKVFRITSGRYSKNTVFTQRRSFRNMSTRAHYAGRHLISVIVNGREGRKKRFLLR